MLECFKKSLALATEESPIVLLLDAVDQILFDKGIDQICKYVDTYICFIEGKCLEWVPESCPANVKILISVAADARTCLTVLNSRKKKVVQYDVLPLAVSSLISLLRFTSLLLQIDEGEQMLDLWLANAKRTLTPDQKKLVLSNFSQCPLPLYLRIAFECSIHWQSYLPQ